MGPEQRQKQRPGSRCQVGRSRTSPICRRQHISSAPARGSCAAASALPARLLTARMLTARMLLLLNVLHICTVPADDCPDMDLLLSGTITCALCKQRRYPMGCGPQAGPFIDPLAVGRGMWQPLCEARVYHQPRPSPSLLLVSGRSIRHTCRADVAASHI